MTEGTKREDASVVWSPSQELRETCALTRFIRKLERAGFGSFSTFQELHRWSVEQPHLFWPQLVSFLDLIGEGQQTPIYADTIGPTPLARLWFPNYSLNFAENLLIGDDSQTALVAWSEDRQRRQLSMGELRADVGRVARYLSDCGVQSGDRVFAYLPNIPEAVVCALATATLGAIWSSCGTDFQVEGLLARVERVRPRIFIAADSYLRRGNVIPLLPTIQGVVQHVSSIEHLLIVNYLHDGGNTAAAAEYRCGVASYNALESAVLPEFKRLPFSHPLYVMFSSGTTGKPKGIVHGAGGVLLEHKKEMVLHADIRSGDRVFYQTSTSWMMWNWLISALASRATIVMYDGDSLVEEGAILWRLADQERVTHFGTSAAYLAEIEKRGMAPHRESQLPELRAIFSTGSTLLPGSFDYVMRAIKPVWLQSISGGTDILGCFGLGCPLKPVRRGEVQCKSLGYDVRIFNPAGEAVIGEQGELVCVSAAPSMPLQFLDDPQGSAYQDAYFADFAGIWRHGDYVEETTDGGLIFGGRSDATLKPGGVRVATADIYSALQRVPQISGALAVGYTPAGESSERIILFVVLHEGAQLSELLQDAIRRELKLSNAFYVPALILQAPELPRTANNKLAELSVKRILRGDPPGNASVLANPESLRFFIESAAPQVRANFGS